ncbi:hypothetical protein ACVJGD_000411 [Bradyrhizobium sp. USDA 10063]
MARLEEPSEDIRENMRRTLLISPRALALSPYHRAIWDLRP